MPDPAYTDSQETARGDSSLVGIDNPTIEQAANGSTGRHHRWQTGCSSGRTARKAAEHNAVHRFRRPFTFRRKPRAVCPRTHPMRLFAVIITCISTCLLQEGMLFSERLRGCTQQAKCDDRRCTCRFVLCFRRKAIFRADRVRGIQSSMCARRRLET